MMWLAFIAFVCVIEHSVAQQRYIQVQNQNNFPIWMEEQDNTDQPQLAPGIIKINPGDSTTYSIPDSGWSGRLWPKSGCDDSDANCEIGQSVPPCPDGGCQPPSETKVEFFFPQISSGTAYYDISLVDGFSQACKITPYRGGQPVQDGSCIETDCHLLLTNCPQNEQSDLGDLAVYGRSNNAVSCLSPCKKWNYPPPYGFGRNEQDGDGRLLCCPSPVTAEECRSGIVEETNYVQLVHRDCPTAYSFSYDDEGGLHNCPSDTSFSVVYSS
ncbi:glucan endo-1,3-beta-glucosidase-like [Contarinia nasturtii]|uniref:glucan endo-1,3-beta-glucosidase-like n=1 Tax=Contarinia nasturtii TaxID=265458 RepID=UPI0012D46687|nr:glucan endo-1,3-beta-glucosidase-like [Contarinia nasturtii]